MICAARLSRSMPSRVNTWTSITRAGDARRHAQARVLHVGGLLAEDRAEQLLFRRQLRLALRRHLADQHVAGLDFGADVDDAGFVEARPSCASPRLEMSRVISSAPSLVSRATTESSSMWIDV